MQIYLQFAEKMCIRDRRSFIIIGIGCSLLWLYASGKLRSSLTIAGITIPVSYTHLDVYKRQAANVSNLYHTYAYSKETMRGKSELVQTGDAAKQRCV